MYKSIFAAVTLMASIFFPVRGIAAAQAQRPTPMQYQQKITQEVRHQLVMLPYYSVFDNLVFSVNGDAVTLAGQVTQPVLKSDAEKAVKSVEGVATVVNNIEVLPVSTNDDRLRRALYQAIYGDPQLQMYELRAVPPIHIIVKNGHATLVGVVANEMDKNVAGIRAKTVPGLFSVENQLEVENKK